MVGSIHLSDRRAAGPYDNSFAGTGLRTLQSQSSIVLQLRL